MRLILDNISKRFGEKKVLEHIHLEAESGKALGILGRNGAGKTTMIRIIMNVFPPEEGQVLFEGKKREELKIGYLPEERGMYAKKPILKQLVYFAQLKGMKKSDAGASAEYWLDRMGLAEYKFKRLDTLSKGNQQKVQLIAAVEFDPDIVILDEPFSGLDPVNAALLKDVVLELIQKGKIVLFSSHQMSYVEEFCDEIAILNGGKIVLSGNLKEIKREYPRDRLVVLSPQLERIQDFLGEAAQRDGDQLFVQLSHPDKKKEMMELLASKFEIDEMRVYEPQLNDIFVQYTEKQI